MPDLSRSTRIVQPIPPRAGETLVADAINILGEYLRPDGLTREQAMDRLLALFDCPEAWVIYEAEMNRRNPRDVESWH